MKILNNFKYIILGILLTFGATVHGINVSVPFNPGTTGYTFTSATSTLATTTTSMLNGVVVVDGIRYPQTGAGIQSAINDAKAFNPKRNVYIPGGEYPVTTRINMADINGMTISGAGSATRIYAANSLYVSGQDHYKGMFFIDGHTATTSNVTIKDLVLDANMQDRTPAMTIGGGSASAGMTNVTVKNVIMKNVDSTTAVGALNIFSDTWPNLYSDPHGRIDGLTLENIETASSTYFGIFMLGGYVTNFTLKDSHIHDSGSHGFSFSDTNHTDLGTDLGGGDGGTYRTWKIENNRFEDNFKIYGSGSRAHVMMNTQGGVTDLAINGNYFGGFATTTREDYMGINIYNSIGTKIQNNYFGENIQGISVGKSQAANYYLLNPMQYMDISGNTFYRSTKTFDNDSAIGVNMHHNSFHELWGSVFGVYSRHYPAIVASNIIVDVNQKPDQWDVGACEAKSAFCLVGNEGLVIENNTIIDDRLLVDPTTAPTLSETAGGALGARTYYVKYTWLNANGEETLPSPQATRAVSANTLLTVTLPSSINTTWATGNGVPDGARIQRIYVSEVSGSETAQWDITQYTQDFTWTEPTTGLVAGAALPGSNTTQGLTGHAIYESNGNGDASLPNIYRNNQITGVTTTPIVLSNDSTSISIGNVYNVNSNTGSDDIEYQILPTVASSTLPILNIQATSTDFLVNLQNFGSGGLLNILNNLGSAIFTILANGNVGVSDSSPENKFNVIGTVNVRESDDGGDAIRLVSNTGSGQLSVYRGGSVQHQIVGDGNTIFNVTQQGGSRDFSVRGDTDTNLFYVDVSADTVGIGTSTPTTNLQVTTASSNATSTLTVGKANQTKGSCLELFDAVGTAYYISIVGGALNLTTTSCK